MALFLGAEGDFDPDATLYINTIVTLCGFSQTIFTAVLTTALLARVARPSIKVRVLLGVHSRRN